MTAIPTIRPSLTPAGVSDLKSKPKTEGSSSPEGLSFSNMLDGLSQQQNQSDGLIKKLAAGEDVDLHQVMIASEQTDISFKVAIAMRDRLVEAYREVSRMGV
jgi:flagellar hook-basal body complex protein FliE